MSNKLHELLAIEQDRRTKANASIEEGKQTFSKKDAHFDGMVKKYVPTEENAEEIPDERKELTLTVKGYLGEMMQAIVPALDANLSKEETNASNTAKAELLLEEQSLGVFSATSLLALESHISKLRELYKLLPTLDTTRKWTFDSQLNLFRSEDEIKFRSIKRSKVIVKYDATKEHPAQTELVSLDVQVGKYQTTYFSGKVTPSQKTKMLNRIDQLLEAIKIARSKANSVEVNNIKIGKKIFDLIHQDIL
jgi:hypothetical protein